MKTILIAEDDPETRFLIQKAIEPLGHRIVTAGDGVEALEQAGLHRPNLVLLDVLMPQGHGYSVCRALRARPEMAATKIVFLSSKAYTADRRQAMQLGADGYLTKPFNVLELRQAVTEMLSGGPDREP